MKTDFAQPAEQHKTKRTLDPRQPRSPHAAGPGAAARRACQPPPIRSLRAELPEWLDVLITRLHAKQPARRYASAAEVMDVLNRHDD